MTSTVEPLGVGVRPPTTTPARLPRQPGRLGVPAPRPPRARDLVVVANRLPGSLLSPEPGSAALDSGGLSSALSSLIDAPAQWVGALGADTAQNPAVDRRTTSLIRLSDADQELYYQGWCNATLWPLLHEAEVPPFRAEWWDAYQRVNARFVARLSERAPTNALVWVHDYHLMLVPEMLRARRPDLRIGFFLHTPFPSAALHRVPTWQKLLRGLLGADVVGFQTESDAAAFHTACAELGSAVVSRPGQVRTVDDDRTVRVSVFPISIDTADFERLSELPAIVGRAAQIRRDLGNPRTLLLGVDRLDYTKGIPERLEAVDDLLTEGSLVPGLATYVQVATPTRPGVPRYDELRMEVEGAVGRVLGRHSKVGAAPVHYLHASLPRDELVALYLAADVMLVTPLRDGMNLVAKEYVATRRSAGGLVLSRSAGAAHELSDAWLVNPHDREDMKEGLRAAVFASAEERRRRMTRMSEHVRTNDVHRWASSFLTALRGDVEISPSP